MTDGVEPHYIKEEILAHFFKHFWNHRMALDRRNFRQVREWRGEVRKERERKEGERKEEREEGRKEGRVGRKEGRKEGRVERKEGRKGG